MELSNRHLKEIERGDLENSHWQEIIKSNPDLIPLHSSLIEKLQAAVSAESDLFELSDIKKDPDTTKYRCQLRNKQTGKTADISLCIAVNRSGWSPSSLDITFLQPGFAIAGPMYCQDADGHFYAQNRTSAEPLEPSVDFLYQHILLKLREPI